MDGEPNHSSPELGWLLILNRPQSPQERLGPLDRELARWFEPGKRGQVRLSPAIKLQRWGCQVHAPDFGVLLFGERAVLLFAPQPQAQSRLRPPGAPRP